MDYCYNEPTNQRGSRMNDTQAASYARQYEYFTKHYGALKGYTIVDVEILAEREYGFPEFWPRLYLANPETGESIVIDVSQDEEGNGPGYLFISHYE